MIDLEATPLLLAHAELAEGPVWEARRAILWWVDITPGLVHAYDPASGADQPDPIGRAVGAAALRVDRTLLVLDYDFIEPRPRSPSPARRAQGRR